MGICASGPVHQKNGAPSDARLTRVSPTSTSSNSAKSARAKWEAQGRGASQKSSIELDAKIAAVTSGKHAEARPAASAAAPPRRANSGAKRAWKSLLRNEGPDALGKSSVRDIGKELKELEAGHRVTRGGTVVKLSSVAVSAIRRLRAARGSVVGGSGGVGEEAELAAQLREHEFTEEELLDLDLPQLFARGFGVDEATNAILVRRIQSSETTATEVQSAFRATPEASRTQDFHLVVAESLIKKGEPLMAEEILYLATKRFKDDTARRIRQLHGLALAQGGSTERGIAVLEALQEEGAMDDEGGGLLARCYKDLAARERNAERRTALLNKAHAIYRGAYEAGGRGSYYTGINTATMALLTGRTVEAIALADDVVELCRKELEGELGKALAAEGARAAGARKEGEEDKEEEEAGPRAPWLPERYSDGLLSRLRPHFAEGLYWCLATIGEASVIIGDFESAAEYYSAARECAEDSWVRIASTQRQLRLLLRHKVEAGLGPQALRALQRGEEAAVRAARAVDAGSGSGISAAEAADEETAGAARSRREAAAAASDGDGRRDRAEEEAIRKRVRAVLYDTRRSIERQQDRRPRARAGVSGRRRARRASLPETFSDGMVKGGLAAEPRSEGAAVPSARAALLRAFGTARAALAARSAGERAGGGGGPRASVASDAERAERRQAQEAALMARDGPFACLMDVPTVAVFLSAEVDEEYVVPTPHAELALRTQAEAALAESGTRFVYCSPCTLADVVFLEAAAGMGCELYVVLPVPMDVHVAWCTARFMDLERYDDSVRRATSPKRMRQHDSSAESSAGGGRRRRKAGRRRSMLFSTSGLIQRLRDVLANAARVDVANDMSPEMTVTNRHYASLLVDGLARKRAQLLGTATRRIYAHGSVMRAGDTVAGWLRKRPAGGEFVAQDGVTSSGLHLMAHATCSAPGAAVFASHLTAKGLFPGAEAGGYGDDEDDEDEDEDDTADEAEQRKRALMGSGSTAAMDAGGRSGGRPPASAHAFTGSAGGSAPFGFAGTTGIEDLAGATPSLHGSDGAGASDAAGWGGLGPSVAMPEGAPLGGIREGPSGDDDAGTSAGPSSGPGPGPPGRVAGSPPAHSPADGRAGGARPRAGTGGPGSIFGQASVSPRAGAGAGSATAVGGIASPAPRGPGHRARASAGRSAAGGGGGGGGAPSVVTSQGRGGGGSSYSIGWQHEGASRAATTVDPAIARTLWAALAKPRSSLRVVSALRSGTGAGGSPGPAGAAGSAARPGAAGGAAGAAGADPSVWATWQHTRGGRDERRRVAQRTRGRRHSFAGLTPMEDESLYVLRSEAQHTVAVVAAHTRAQAIASAVAAGAEAAGRAPRGGAMAGDGPPPEVGSGTARRLSGAREGGRFMRGASAAASSAAGAGGGGGRGGRSGSSSGTGRAEAAYDASGPGGARLPGGFGRPRDSIGAESVPDSAGHVRRFSTSNASDAAPPARHGGRDSADRAGAASPGAADAGGAGPRRPPVHPDSSTSPLATMFAAPLAVEHWVTHCTPFRVLSAPYSVRQEAHERLLSLLPRSLLRSAHSAARMPRTADAADRHGPVTEGADVGPSIRIGRRGGAGAASAAASAAAAAAVSAGHPELSVAAVMAEASAAGSDHDSDDPAGLTQDEIDAAGRATEAAKSGSAEGGGALAAPGRRGVTFTSIVSEATVRSALDADLSRALEILVPAFQKRAATMGVPGPRGMPPAGVAAFGGGGSPLLPAPARRQVIAAPLFADVVNFSKLSEPQVLVFIENVLGAIANLIDTMPRRARPRIQQTWGDALYGVWSRVPDAGEFALMLSDLITKVPWHTLGLPNNLNIRISLHAAPVHVVTDPILRLKNYTGVHTSRAARIEPITPPGSVYCTQAFAAISEMLGVQSYECTYVGNVPLAKKYGMQPVFAVRWKSSSRSVPRKLHKRLRATLLTLALRARKTSADPGGDQSPRT